MILTSNFKHAVANRDHYLAIGMSQMYLDVGPYPWHLVTDVEPGGTHRFDIATSVNFTARVDEEFSVRWSFDIEPHSVTGVSGYRIDVEGCEDALQRLSRVGKTKFRKLLVGCAQAVEAKGAEYMAAGQKQLDDAKLLRIAAGVPDE